MMDSSDDEEFQDASNTFEWEETESPKSFSYIPPPREVTVLHAVCECVSLSWEPDSSFQRCKFQIHFSSDTHQDSVTVEDQTTVDIEGLTPGTEYTFTITRIAENGRKSESVSVSAFTEPSPPAQITGTKVCSDSVSLQWEPPAGESVNYTVACYHEEEIVQELITDTDTVTFSSLKPGSSYSFHVSSQLQNGKKSTPTVTSVKTKTLLESLLEEIGLGQYYKQKLSLGKILEIDENAITDKLIKHNSDLPWYFLKKLMMVNVTARNTKYSSAYELNCDEVSGNAVSDLRNLASSPNTDDMINPLDIITALFLCSDGFVQQEMALKMSMCQFSVPLLLPNADTNQCTLMLWAMRDIVKKYRPQSLSQTKGFVEERIVLSELPMISFVRLGECSFSKSEILNKLLSNSQQYQDIFLHYNMESCDSQRRISNGLTEITWYLPGGNTSIDIFSQPVTVANLRGDIASFERQYSFLCQASAAVFVFFDNLDPNCSVLTNQHRNTQIYLVGNEQSKSFNLNDLQLVASKLRLTNNIILKSKKTNDATFVNSLRKKVSDVVKNFNMKMKMEKMVDMAHELGILVDEDSTECQDAKKNAKEITAEIQDILEYKEAQLPLQGQIWKDLTSLDKEKYHLQNVGSQDIEKYKSDLNEKIKKLRKQQNSYDISPGMTRFISAISSTGSERFYFLRWMRMNLDNVSQTKLSKLKEQYKEKCKNSEKKEEIRKIDRQISNSSLGTEHFFREMGQIYEASLSLPQTCPSSRQLQHLPKLCAELLLDGFPLELVDGDASNIPLKWVSDVLIQLNDLVSPNGKILVVTVLGVQSTGKSTLLNTMFGVQFAVSSGRCTRGAFMLLIKINEDIKKQINCDYIVIIDTEGLKSPELAQLDNSYEHDNELATLAVGLSDVTIVNIAMENLTEMKDILQIVVHAFLRMKEVGKKPKCLFVHQNVSDVSAPEKNLRDRKLLLQQLNEMTQAAAKMEKKEENKSFTDVMEYNPDTGNWYIPGLWNGNPPMAPVNAGYSEAVYELKKNIIQQMENCESTANNISDFKEWVTSLWNAIKHENFIFSFRNSLVADAYMRLCTEFNKWEWEFKKEMYNWSTCAETRISNVRNGADAAIASQLKDLRASLKSEAFAELSEWETKLLENLNQYFKRTEGHVYLVEGYKEGFSISANNLRKEMERSVLNQLTVAVDIRQGKAELDTIKKNHKQMMETAVFALIEDCREKKVKAKDKELEEEFDKMWNKTLEKLSFSKQEPSNVLINVSHCLRNNLSHKGGAHKLLSKTKLQDFGKKPFECKAEGFFQQCEQTFRKMFNWEDHIKAVQKQADSIINECEELITEMVQRKSNYHENYMQELLNTVDERLDSNHAIKTDIKFEVSLKQHICAIAARQFQKMNENFIKENDPYRCLHESKEKFFDAFKDLFHERDQCQKKAEEFTTQCLKPAVKYYINHFLGPEIVDEMLKEGHFSTRTFSQYSILLDLLSKKDFRNYLDYIRSYEDYVKKWILSQMFEHFTNKSAISELEDKLLKSCISTINDAVKKAKTTNLKTFVESICEKLGNKLVISQDALENLMMLNNANQEQFAHWLSVSVNDMAEELKNEFRELNFEKKLTHLHMKPQNEIFTKMIGCGKQCPFCAVPCEAGGKAHTEHWTSLHRPNGLGEFRFVETKKLVTDICSSLVISDRKFSCSATKFTFHPYKSYRDIFKDWKIQTDVSLEASDYWKYVMVQYNSNFAEAYSAIIADIPPAWKNITKEQAERSLKESFNMK
ncbi:interferon-induced very large GTPase 1-like isoform 1-T2 [Pholidichthys leucotaenia]